MASMDLGMSLGAVSLRAAIELLRAAPDVAPLVTPDDLRIWGEISHRIATTNHDAAIQFLSTSAETLATMPQAKRTLLLQLVARQAVLSYRTAIDSFHFAPHLIATLGDSRLSSEILTICLELSRHSVKHSGELLANSPKVILHLQSIDPSLTIAYRAVGLASAFAHRSGGTAADFFAKLPLIVCEPRLDAFGRLFAETEICLERSGSVALQYFIAGGYILNSSSDEVFDRWSRLCQVVSLHGNASSYHFLKFSPSVIGEFVKRDQKNGRAIAREVLDVVTELAALSPQAAIECLRSAPKALANASIVQFRQWALDGIDLVGSNQKKLQAYYALESRGSREALKSNDGGLTLESILHTLKLYVEGLTGQSLNLSSLQDVPEESTIGDGSTIYLPSVVDEFGDDDDDFRLFKVLAAHGAGQIEFGTYERSTDSIKAVRQHISERYVSTRFKKGRFPKDFGYSDILLLFPNPVLARQIFTTIENARIDSRLRGAYRGIRRDLDFIRDRLFSRRPDASQLPMELALHELLLQAAIGGGVQPELALLYSSIAGEIERIVDEYARKPLAGVSDSIVATGLVYDIAVSLATDSSGESAQSRDGDTDENGDGLPPDGQGESPNKSEREQLQTTGTPQISHWSQTTMQPESSEIESLLSAPSFDAPEQDLEPGDVAYSYDEWDRELNDHRIGWCRIIERRATRGTRSFVELVRSKYAGPISSIRYQFQMMRPENLTRVRGEIDGEDYDLQAVIDYAIDRRAIGRGDDRLYMRKLRRERDVAVAFLLDMSSSTARTISRYPNQPYSHPGRRIIDIEKEGLVLMSEALEAVGDLYAMHGFTSEGRRNVKFYVIKDFSENYSADVEKRIGGITYQNNTRLGTAIRHSVAKLVAQQARTKLLIVLSDGRPYDHDYGDSRYAREDTKLALRHAKLSGIRPFCITIDRESEDQLRDMYGEVGYTIIDDVLSLPERMPAIYRRLTT